MTSFGAKSYEDQIHAIWVDPTQFDPLRHAPPFLPPGRPAVKLAATQKAQVQGWVKQAHGDTEQSVHLLAKDYGGDLGYMSVLLTCLRAAAMVHQTHHWQTRGPSFYGDHQLFERLYNETLPGIDSVAERTVGLGSPSLVDPVIQAKHLAWCIAKCYQGTKVEEGPNGMVAVSLHVEYHVLAAIKTVLGVLGQAGILSDGTENLLQDIADKHEEFVYLLKQRNDVAPYSYGR